MREGPPKAAPRAANGSERTGGFAFGSPRHFGSSAAQLGREQVRRYLLHLVEQSSSARRHTRVLEQPKVVAELPRRRRTRTLPTVLTPAEVQRLFAALGPSALGAGLMLAYGAGLRVGEACRLRLQDVDSRAGVLHVRNTKRNRDRDVMLSPKLLAELRAYTSRLLACRA